MEYVPSKKIGYADGLSRLIPKYTEPLEETVIAALRDESELLGLLCNTIRELPVTLDDVKKAAENDDFIKKMKKQVWLNEETIKGMSVSPFSICDHVLLYADRVVMLCTLQKKF